MLAVFLAELVYEYAYGVVRVVLKVAPFALATVFAVLAVTFPVVAFAVRRGFRWS